MLAFQAAEILITLPNQHQVHISFDHIKMQIFNLHSASIYIVMHWTITHRFIKMKIIKPRFIKMKIIKPKVNSVPVDML